MPHVLRSGRCHRYLLIAAPVIVLAASIAGAPRWPGALPQPAIAAPDTATPPSAPLPVGFRRFTSKVLPYRIGYPPGWHADGSIFGSLRRPAGVYYDADTFTKPRVASITVQGEKLPPGSLLTSASYGEVLLLELERGKEAESNLTYTATRLGAAAVSGAQAYLFEVRRGTGSDTLETTEAVFVARGRGWRIGLTTPAIGAGHAALVPTFRTMLQTFRLR